MAKLITHDLYGGAITCQLPSNYIDSSTLREIPSHQEVYLSPTTLTSIIVEINQYELSQPSEPAAAIYHFKDMIDPADTLQALSDPTAVSMQHPSLSDFPAYVVRGTVVSTEKGSSTARVDPGTILPAEWEQTPTTQMIEVKTVMFQLVVRMERVGTDLCVRVNVPMKEFEGEEAAGEKEMEFARECLERVVESLEVGDFGLFEG